MNDNEKLNIIKALANDNRFLIIKILRNLPAGRQGTKEISVGDLAEKINSPLRSTSKDLAILRKVNLVQFRKKFVRKYYSIDTASFPKELLKFLDN